MENDLALARSLVGLSQSDVARWAGCTQKHVSLVERDLREPSLEFMERTAQMLALPVDKLFPDHRRLPTAGEAPPQSRRLATSSGAHARAGPPPSDGDPSPSQSVGSRALEAVAGTTS